jgi:hypothetical protein
LVRDRPPRQPNGPARGRSPPDVRRASATGPLPPHGRRPADTQVDTVEIPVAKKDLPVGMKIPKDEIDQYVEMKKMSRESAPPIFVETKEALADKRVKRTRRAGDTFNPEDLADTAPIQPPPGFNPSRRR